MSKQSKLYKASWQTDHQQFSPKHRRKIRRLANELGCIKNKMDKLDAEVTNPPNHD